MGRTKRARRDQLAHEHLFGQSETLLAQINISMAAWSEVVRLPNSKKGLRFSIVNTELPGALQTWFKSALGSNEDEDEESAKMRELLLKKGVVMSMSSEETDLGEFREAVLMWNGRNKNLSENDEDYGDSPKSKAFNLVD